MPIASESAMQTANDHPEDTSVYLFWTYLEIAQAWEARATRGGHQHMSIASITLIMSRRFEVQDKLSTRR